MKKLLIIFAVSILGMVACNEERMETTMEYDINAISNNPLYPSFSEVVGFLQSNNWGLIDSFADADHPGALIFHYNKLNENRFLIRWASLEDIPHRPNVDFDDTYDQVADPDGPPGSVLDVCVGDPTNCFVRNEGGDVFIDCLDEDLPT
jgi:hypothetical protein